MRTSRLGLCLLPLLSACGDEDPPPPRAPLSGSYQQVGYARVVHFGPNEVHWYDVSEDYCSPAGSAPRAPFEAQYTFFDRAGGGFGWMPIGHFTRYDFDPLIALPATCNPPSPPETAFDAMWQMFDENYAFFSLRGLDWTRTSSLADGLGSRPEPEALMAAMQAALTPLNDSHVFVFDPEGGQGFFAGGMGALWHRWADQLPAGTSPHGDNPLDPARKFIDAMRTHVRIGILGGRGKADRWDIFHWGMLDEQTAYLNLHEAYAEEAAEWDSEAIAAQVHTVMAEVMADLRGAKRMVLDLRFNQGGADVVGLAMASWFTTTRRAVMMKMARTPDGYTAPQLVHVEGRPDAFTGPLEVLISGNTISAAETFALALRELPQAELVGTPTHGTLSDVLRRQLPNGWVVGISNEIYASPGAEVFEAVGVPPDRAVPWDEGQSFEANLQRTLQAALEAPGGR